MTSLEDWIVSQGLSGPDLAALFSGFMERLVEERIPVVRAFVALPTVNPIIRIVSHTWTRRTGMVAEGVPHDRDLQAFEVSPLAYMLRNGLRQCHWRLDEPGIERFSVFDEVERAGGTDYLARIIAFDNQDAPALPGVGMAFSTDRRGGFLPEEIRRIDTYLPLLALAAYRITLFDLTVAVLDTYIGLSAGRQVLRGEIRRGSGATITAALMFADLRGFTALADRSDARLITRLGQHLEAMAEPVMERGGEVLKFLGDGLLAAFPVDDERPPRTACAAAVRAAQAALVRNEAVNRVHAGMPPLDLDIALHYGDVFYGNIGTASRLDFTVIGPAVNEASRMEALCSTLGCSLVLSAKIAAMSPVPLRSLGRHTLRGVTERRELFTLEPARAL